MVSFSPHAFGLGPFGDWTSPRSGLARKIVVTQLGWLIGWLVGEVVVVVVVVAVVVVVVVVEVFQKSRFREPN